MKNVIFILVDSVFSECLGCGRTKESTTPFIDSLISQGLFADSVYSYGPYTDAATRGLYCGNKTLTDYGYFFGTNSSDYSHFRAFKENGYETIGLYYPYYLLGSKISKYIDHSVFIGGFEYKSEWGGKYSYYSKIKAERPLTDLEYSLLIKHCELMFDCWVSFYEKIANEKDSDLIVKNIKSNKNDSYELLMNEFELFENNKIKYIDSILDLGLNHPLAFINEYSEDNILTKKRMDALFKEKSAFLKRLSRIQFARNIFPPNSSIKGFFTQKDFLKTIY